MELTRFKRYLHSQSENDDSYRDVLALLDIADLIREEAEYYEDELRQQQAPNNTDMQFFVIELVDKVVDALCELEGVSKRDVTHRIIETSFADVEMALSDWKDEQNRDSEPLGDLDEHPFLPLFYHDEKR